METGFDSLDEFFACMKENRDLKRKNEEFEKRVAHLRNVSRGLASGISKRDNLIRQKESALDDLKKQTDKLKPLEEELQRSVDKNSEIIKLAFLVFWLADRRIKSWKKYGSRSPWEYRQIAFEKLKKEYGVDPYNWKELRKEIAKTVEGLIVSNPRIRSALFEAMSKELTREGMPPKPHEDPREHVGRLSEKVKKVLIKGD